MTYLSRGKDLSIFEAAEGVFALRVWFEGASGQTGFMGEFHLFKVFFFFGGGGGICWDFWLFMGLEVWRAWGLGLRVSGLQFRSQVSWNQAARVEYSGLEVCVDSRCFSLKP